MYIILGIFKIVRYILYWLLNKRLKKLDYDRMLARFMLFKFREKAGLKKTCLYLSISTHPGRFILKFEDLIEMLLA